MDKITRLVFSGLLLVLFAGFVSAFAIDSPNATTYDTHEIFFSVMHNDTLDSITYGIDDGSTLDACTDCAGFSTTLNLSDGEHIIYAYGLLGNESFYDNVTFNVEVPPVYTFQIIQPEAMEYNTSMVPLSIVSDNVLDSITYDLNGDVVDACTDCSEFNDTLNLTDGDYTLTASGVLGATTMNETVEFSVNTTVPEVNETTNETTVAPFTLSILSPVEKTYNTSDITVNLTSNVTLDELYYTIDLETFNACTDCADYIDVHTLSDGTYTLTAYGLLNDTEVNASVVFNVSTHPEYTLTVESPLSKAYYDTQIPVLVSTDKVVDLLTADVDGHNWTCTNCSLLNDTVILDYGEHTLHARAVLDSVEKEVSVEFTVEHTAENQTEEDFNETPRFSTGFEKLPQMVEAGQFTDAQLADIIRNNQLNPGVINRLIKTGMLGNESLNAIIDTQFNPPGIFKKLWSWIGFHVETYSSLIAENYAVGPETAKKLVEKESLPNVRARVQAEVQNEEGKVPPGQAKKVTSQTQTQTENGNSGKTPPGQAKKQAPMIPADNNDTNVKTTGNSGKIPPGQAKKY